MLTGAAGVAIVVLALVGGALSGKLEHRPTARLAAAPPPVPTTSTTASTTPEQATATQVVKLALIEDMTLDVRSQRLDPDVHRRLALAETPTAIARRHAEIARAWAPDKVASTQARYDEAVRANAADPSSPSVTDGAFVVTHWGDVGIVGTVAHAMCRGHYRLIEPAGPQVPGGAVEQSDRDWTITLVQTGSHWRLEDRSATP